MFDLDTLEEEQQEPALVLGYTEGFRPCQLDSPEQIGVVRVWMRSLNGKDDRAIMDAMLKTTVKGETKVGAGTTSRMKVCRSVTRIDGLGRGGEEFSIITPKIYDGLKSWLIEKMRAKVQEINGEEDPPEGE